jgi:hypothetical protein
MSTPDSSGDDVDEKLLPELILASTKKRVTVRRDRTSMPKLAEVLDVHSEFSLPFKELVAAGGCGVGEGYQKVLGRGAFATVYLGVVRGVEVAIKVS